MGEGALTIATLITSVGDVLTGLVSWMGTVITFITGQPLVMIFVLLTICITAFAAVSRMVKGV